MLSQYCVGKKHIPVRLLLLLGVSPPMVVNPLAAAAMVMGLLLTMGREPPLISSAGTSMDGRLMRVSGCMQLVGWLWLLVSIGRPSRLY